MGLSNGPIRLGQRMVAKILDFGQCLQATRLYNKAGYCSANKKANEWWSLRIIGDQMESAKENLKESTATVLHRKNLADHQY